MRLALVSLALPLCLFLAIAVGVAPTAQAQDPYDRERNCEREFSDCLQECFDAFLQNEESCIDLWCDSFLFLRWCDEDELGSCLRKVEETWDGCRDACRAALQRCRSIT